MKKTRIGIAVLAAASLTLAACSSTDDENVAEPGEGANVTSTEDILESTGETTSEVSDPVDHNDADIEFAQMMIPHHEQAVELSDILLAKEGLDPRVQDLAERIRASQDPESQQMRAWLDSWGAQQPEDTTMDHSDMEGMLDPEEVSEIEAADAPEAQKLFLEHMISHHEGAVDMAETHLDNGRNEDARALSQQVISTQEAEIDEMKQLQDEL